MPGSISISQTYNNQEVKSCCAYWFLLGCADICYKWKMPSSRYFSSKLSSRVSINPKCCRPDSSPLRQAPEMMEVRRLHNPSDSMRKLHLCYFSKQLVHLIWVLTDSTTRMKASLIEMVGPMCLGISVFRNISAYINQQHICLGTISQ